MLLVFVDWPMGGVVLRVGLGSSESKIDMGMRLTVIKVLRGFAKRELRVWSERCSLVLRSSSSRGLVRGWRPLDSFI